VSLRKEPQKRHWYRADLPRSYVIRQAVENAYPQIRRISSGLLKHWLIRPLSCPFVQLRMETLVARIKLFVLGEFQLLIDGQRCEKFRSEKARAMLAFLTQQGDLPVRRSVLANLFWHGYQSSSALASVRVTLTNLRQLLAPFDLIRCTARTVQIVSSHPDFWCDALALDQLMHEAEDGLHAERLAQARKLHRGQFLAGFETIDTLLFQTWLQERQAHYQDLRATIEQQWRVWSSEARPVETASQQPVVGPMVAAGPVTPVDRFRAVPTVESFYGRQAELDQLSQWILGQPGAPRTRLVAILGMGGQGKSALAAHWIRSRAAPPPQLEEEAFTHILWSSLLNAPPLNDVLQDWLELLSDHQIKEETASLDRQLDLLIAHLNRERCLLILDNVESIMATGARSGQYRPGYEGYGQLLQRVGEIKHQSCLLLTSREEPYGWKRLAMGATAIRSLRLGGMTVQAGQAMLQDYGLTSSAEASAEVVRRYSGNPLALKLVAAVIHEIFGGDIRAFLAEETLIFDDIRDVLDQHFARLSVLESELMYWLAIEREPVLFATQCDNLVQAPSHRAVLESVNSLQRRSLLEQVGEQLSLQNVITEYATDRLVAAISQELADFRFAILDFGWTAEQAQIQNPKSAIQNSLVHTHLNQFALVKAQAKEYVRESQVRLLLQPVAEHLTGHWSKEAVAKRLRQHLDRRRSEAPLEPGYAGANIIHLLIQLKIDMGGYDFSRLAIWQADLRNVGLPAVNFAQADLTNSVLKEPFEIIRSLAFSSDGRHLIGGAYNGDIHVWRMADHQLERLLQGHRGVVYSVAISPNGRLLASASSDQTARLWDLATGELYCILRGHDSEVVLVAFDASGELLISMGQDGVIRTWAAPTLLNTSVCDQPLTKFGGTVNPTYKAAASWDGARVASGGDDGIVHCWDIQSGQLSASWQGHTQPIIGLAISPDGKTLASSGYDQAIRLWTLTDQAEAAGPDRLRYSMPEDADPLAYSPDGALLASGFDPHLCLWEVQEPTGRGKLRQRLVGHTGKIAALSISPDGKTLASSSYDQSVLLWNVNSGQAEHKLYGQARSVELVQFSPDGATLVSSYYDHTLHLWAQDGRHLHSLGGHEDVVRHVAYSPDSHLLATSGNHKTIHLWDLRSGEHRFTLRRHTSSVPSLVISPDGVTLVSGGADALVCLWDMHTGEPIGTLQGHSSQIRSMAFNAEGTLLVTGSADHTICIWDMGAPGSPASERGQLRHLLQGHTVPVRFVAFHPDGRLVASASDDKTVGIWDAVTGQLCQSLQGHTQAVIYARFSPDGRTLVSGSDDHTLRVWAVDTATGEYQLRHVLPEHIYKFDCVALGPDNTTLVSGSVDTTVRVWDLQTGQLCRALKGHTNLITSVDVSPDGRQIVSSCSNGMVRIWDAQTGECLHTPRPDGPYAGMNITDVTGVTAAQKAALKALGAIEGVVG
jgi:WD40 repeat protein